MDGHRGGIWGIHDEVMRVEICLGNCWMCFEYHGMEFRCFHSLIMGLYITIEGADIYTHTSQINVLDLPKSTLRYCFCLIFFFTSIS